MIFQAAEYVAPFMGAWIETWMGIIWRSFMIVAPFMGAWIETNVLYIVGP